MACIVCSHDKRSEIENALLSISSDNKAVTLETIAQAYQVTTNDLKVHALMHAPMGYTERPEEDGDESIVRKLKLKEADMLSAVANEYMVTLKNVGRRINNLASKPDEDYLFERLMTKAVADLYIGLGGEIRATVKTMAELDSVLNGDSGASTGLQALAEAIRGSK